MGFIQHTTEIIKYLKSFPIVWSCRKLQDEAFNNVCVAEKREKKEKLQKSFVIEKAEIALLATLKELPEARIV